MYTINLCCKAFALISKKNSFNIILLVLLTLTSAIFEILLIAATLPFVESLLSKNVSSNIILNLDFINSFYNFTHQEPVTILGVIFILLLLSSLVLKLFLTWFSNYIIFSTGHEINCLVFNKILSKDYNFFIENSSSSVLGGLHRSEQVRVLITNVIQIFISLIIVSGIFLFAVFLQQQLVIIGFFFILFLYYFFFILLKKKFLHFSKIEAKSINNRLKVMQESFLSIKEIIILNIRNFFIRKYQEYDKKLFKVSIFNALASSMPGQIMITLLLISITLLVLILATNNKINGLQDDIPLIVGLLFSVQRMMPYMQNLFYSFTKIKSSTYSVDSVLSFLEDKNDIDQKNISYQKKIKFNKNIEFKNLFFKYKESKRFTLSNLNFKIKKNSINGIYAKSGRGKTTIVNLISGLLKPSSGKILIDGEPLQVGNLKSWQNNIFYVPQEPALLDTSILENITYKTNNDLIDTKWLNKCLKIVQIYDYVNLLENSLLTIIGEKGVQLSGGQKQRIAIARALFHKKGILILDEATNALDEETERQIYLNIKKYFYNKTIIAISHRKSLYKNFQYIINLSN
jgi:ABC-type multidrug transport system fused ATPase/permease subunit